MIQVVAVMTSCALMLFGMGLVVTTVRGSAAAIMAALAGEARATGGFAPGRLRPANRVRALPVVRMPLRAAA